MSVVPGPELPPSPPSEETVQQSLREAVRGLYTAPGYIGNGNGDNNTELQHNGVYEVSQNTPIASVEYAAPPPAYWQQQSPTSHPMSNPMDVSTPSTTNDDGSSPNWPASPRRRAPRPRARARASRSPRERRTRARRGSTSPVPIFGPFSETTAYLTDVPIKDMHAWAHRSSAERHAEVKRKGKVARPMNAFMMYRSAYSDRAKAFLQIKNYQIVNKVIAASWKLEPEEISFFYKEMSQIEGENHRRTHPDYKFRPKKCPPVATRADPFTPPRGMSSDVLDHESPSTSVWSEVDYSAESPYNRRAGSLEMDHIYHSRANTPHDHASMVTNDFVNASWNGFPASLPTIQPSALHGSFGSHVEDVHYRRSTPVPEELHFGVNGLNAIPGAPHHDLMQPQMHPGGNLDPQMLSYNESTSMSMSMPPAFGSMHNPYPVWDDSHTFLTAPPPSGASSPAPYQNGMAVTSFQANMQRNPSWDPSQHNSNEIGDSWIDL